MKYLVLDFETRSEADLKAIGAYEYSIHPTTEIICASWAVVTKNDFKNPTVYSWSPFVDTKVQGQLLAHALLEHCPNLVAHNASFERYIVKNVLTRYSKIPFVDKITDPKNWICTAAQAAAMALPRSLEGACQALGLDVKKDMVGRRLILKYCKPRKETLSNKDKWHNDESDFKRLIEYCETDVKAESLLFFNTPRLTPYERRVWCVNEEINERGVRCDRPLVTKIRKLIAEEFSFLRKESNDIAGINATQRDALLKWLAKERVILADLKAQTIKDLLPSGLIEGNAKRILEIRQNLTRTSLAKYEALDKRSRSDGRIRDSHVYHAASTGRFGGAGVQLQNLPRGSIADTDTAADFIASNNLESIRKEYKSPVEVFSSCIRSMLTPSQENLELVGADFNAIEVRVLAWLANDKVALEAFEKGEDLYKKMAGKVFGKDPGDVTKAERFLGKTLVLGAGFSIGAKKFHQGVKAQGVDISEDLAKVSIATYRSEHKAVVNLWRDTERAAINAVRSGVKGEFNRFEAGRCQWFVKGSYLLCELPSGRRLAYYKPRVKFEPAPWGEPTPKLYHYDVNAITKAFEESSTYGGRLVENITQAVARDFMVHSMLTLEENGFKILLSVHDEPLSEQQKGLGCEKFVDIMIRKPSWGLDCPIAAEGWTGHRYKK